MLKFTLLDRLIIQVDSLLRHTDSAANYPALTTPESNLPNEQRVDSIKMLRVNHSGEVCAQALYSGQALFCKSNQQYLALIQAANEESDHLAWCKTRLQELNGRTSYLNTFWYAGSYAIGVVAGLYGDKVSLGFLAETEYQVTAHLEKHLERISSQDYRSRAILEKMRCDELRHATHAVNAGAIELPSKVKLLMRFSAKFLTLTAAKI